MPKLRPRTDYRAFRKYHWVLNPDDCTSTSAYNLGDVLAAAKSKHKLASVSEWRIQTFKLFRTYKVPYEV